MTFNSLINSHYGKTDLTGKILWHLKEKGIDLNHLSWEDLTSFDQFHGGQLKTTLWLAEETGLGSGMHVLDIGAGIGGCARVWCGKFGCKVVGVELAEEFCNAAQKLNSLVGMDDKISFIHGDIVEIDLPDDAFEVAMFVNTLMNIQDEASVFKKIYRSLKPGGRLAITTRTATPTTYDGFLYPCPWASDESTNFLSSPESTHSDLANAGFSDLLWNVKPGEKSSDPMPVSSEPSPFELIMDIDVPAMIRNNIINTRAGRLGSLRAVVIKEM